MGREKKISDIGEEQIVEIYPINWNSDWIPTTDGWRCPDEVYDLPVSSLNTGNPWRDFATMFAIIGLDQHTPPENFLSHPEALQGVQCPASMLRLNGYDWINLDARHRGKKSGFALCPRCAVNHVYAAALFTASGGRGYRSGLLQNTTAYLIYRDTIGETVNANRIPDSLPNTYFAPPYAITLQAPQDEGECTCCGAYGPVVRYWWRHGPSRDDSVDTAALPYCPTRFNGKRWVVVSNDSPAAIEEGVSAQFATPPPVLAHARPNDRLWAMAVAWDKAKLLSITEHIFTYNAITPQSQFEKLIKKYIYGALNCIHEISYNSLFSNSDISIVIRRMVERGMHPTAIGMMVYEDRVPFEQPKNWCTYRFCLLRELKKKYGHCPAPSPRKDNALLLQQKMDALRALRRDSVDEEIFARFYRLWPQDISAEQGIAIVRVLLEYVLRTGWESKRKYLPIAAALRSGARQIYIERIFLHHSSSPEWPEILRRVLHYAPISPESAMRLAFVSHPRMKTLSIAYYSYCCSKTTEEFALDIPENNV